MNIKVWLLGVLSIVLFTCAQAQSGADTLHYNKTYYFGGTGLAIPLGKTGRTLSTRLFTGSMGLDISLKNPRYFLLPTIYTMSFNYDQMMEDEDYNRILENGRASIYALSLAGGMRRQFDRLNTYSYIGPALCLDVESRLQDQGNGRARMDNLFAISPAFKVGMGADYKFRGFYLGLEVSYMHHFRKIEDTPINVMTIMVGLKSDITSLSDRVIDVISGSKK